MSKDERQELILKLDKKIGAIKQTLVDVANAKLSLNEQRKEEEKKLDTAVDQLRSLSRGDPIQQGMFEE